jgi:hypothetical protein
VVLNWTIGCDPKLPVRKHSVRQQNHCRLETALALLSAQPSVPPIRKGEGMFRRARYQQGSLKVEQRKKGAAVWVYRWWEKDINGKPVYRKERVGTLEEYASESAAQSAADALRLTINNKSQRTNLRKTTVNTLWEHYSREELPRKELSTQDAYISYADTWILPRWGSASLEEVKTVEVEWWLRAATVSDGTKAKIKCVMCQLCFLTPYAGSSRIEIQFPPGCPLGRLASGDQVQECA